MEPGKEQRYFGQVEEVHMVTVTGSAEQLLTEMLKEHCSDLE